MPRVAALIAHAQRVFKFRFRFPVSISDFHVRIPFPVFPYALLQVKHVDWDRLDWLETFCVVSKEEDT